MKIGWQQTVIEKYAGLLFWPTV